jgi:hypothetical protein
MADHNFCKNEQDKEKPQATGGSTRGFSGSLWGEPMMGRENPSLQLGNNQTDTNSTPRRSVPIMISELSVKHLYLGHVLLRPLL